MKRYVMAAICAALLLGLALAPAAPASAFCIYNKTSKTQAVDQVSGGELGRQFHKIIKPGERACCNWKNKQCNKHGHKHSILTFSASLQNSEKFECKDVRVKAGGWLDIEQKDGKVRCTAHY